MKTPRRVTVPDIAGRKGQARITALTAYDYTIARLLDSTGVDVLLVGDSLGCTIQGHENTLPVTLGEMIYHCRCVTRGVQRALVIGDMPFLSYQSSPRKAIESAGRLLKEGGVSAVKLEGGVSIAQTIDRMVSVDIPVMGHIGLTPQSFHRMGGHKVQGRETRKGHTKHQAAGSRERVIEDALAVERAGAFAVVLEGLPAELATEITATLSIPTIGIGAGKHCDGQILVINDLLGLNPEFTPRFVKRYAELGVEIQCAVNRYCAEVDAGTFPDSAHSFFDPSARMVV